MHGRRGEEDYSDPLPQTAVQLKEKKKKEAKSLRFRLVAGEIDVEESENEKIEAPMNDGGIGVNRLFFTARDFRRRPDDGGGAEERKEQEQADMAKKSEEVKKQSRTTKEEEYERMVLVRNKNLDDSILEARTVEEAVAKFSFVE
ncbi:hypothetical protein LINGRAHAP2_LOCUS25118 [Linum grandiflorum]